jgi:hypothetical protein
MALSARITSIVHEQNGVSFSLTCEFFDTDTVHVIDGTTYQPGETLFTQPGESWSFEGSAGVEYAKGVIGDYGRARLATLQAVDGLAAGDSFAL